MKDELGLKITIKFVALGAKTYNYLMDDGSDNKKAKGKRKCVMKRKLKFENYQNCLEGTQFENKINHLEKNEINIESINKYHLEFIKDNKLMLKTQRIFKSERHKVFTEEINKIDLGSNYHKRMNQLI